MPQLTNKELNQLKDELSREQTLTKKCLRYAEMCTDPQLRSRCGQLAQKHQDHYNTLLNQLY